MARSWRGLTIFACLPCIVAPQSTCMLFSYANNLLTQECYEYAIMSRKNAWQTRLPPALRHKATFAYECILAHAITCRGMHVHAVLSSKEDSIRSMTEERM